MNPKYAVPCRWSEHPSAIGTVGTGVPHNQQLFLECHRSKTDSANPQTHLKEALHFENFP